MSQCLLTCVTLGNHLDELEVGTLEPTMPTCAWFGMLWVGVSCASPKVVGGTKADKGVVKGGVGGVRERDREECNLVCIWLVVGWNGVGNCLLPALASWVGSRDMK